MIDSMFKDPYKSNKRNNVLPHEWRVHESSKKLHQYCDYKVTMKNHISENNACIEFTDIVDVTIKLCDTFDIADISKKSNISCTYLGR